MAIAYNLIRNGAHYMPQAFSDGLAACGWRVKTTLNQPPCSADLLLIWNRYREFEAAAARFEKVGARVLVAENGYFGRDAKGRRFYALSLGQHHAGGAPLNAARLDWPFCQHQQNGRHILICAQRGIGSRSMASPPDWHEKTAAKLAKLTQREIRIRLHPGKDKPAIALADDLKEAAACIVWSSAAGIEALLKGVPVYYDAPHWIAQDSALRLNDAILGGLIDRPAHLCRVAGLCAAASNQWSVEEIQSGKAFAALLGGV